MSDFKEEYFAADVDDYDYYSRRASGKGKSASKPSTSKAPVVSPAPTRAPRASSKSSRGPTTYSPSSRAPSSATTTVSPGPTPAITATTKFPTATTSTSGPTTRSPTLPTPTPSGTGGDGGGAENPTPVPADGNDSSPGEGGAGPTTSSPVSIAPGGDTISPSQQPSAIPTGSGAVPVAPGFDSALAAGEPDLLVANSSTGNDNIGAVIGGIVGGLAFVAIVIVFVQKRSKMAAAKAKKDEKVAAKAASRGVVGDDVVVAPIDPEELGSIERELQSQPLPASSYDGQHDNSQMADTLELVPNPSFENNGTVIPSPTEPSSQPKPDTAPSNGSEVIQSPSTGADASMVGVAAPAAGGISTARTLAALAPPTHQRSEPSRDSKPPAVSGSGSGDLVGVADSDNASSQGVHPPSGSAPLPQQRSEASRGLKAVPAGGVSATNVMSMGSGSLAGAFVSDPGIEDIISPAAGAAAGGWNRDDGSTNPDDPNNDARGNYQRGDDDVELLAGPKQRWLSKVDGNNAALWDVLDDAQSERSLDHGTGTAANSGQSWAAGRAFSLLNKSPIFGGRMYDTGSESGGSVGLLSEEPSISRMLGLSPSFDKNESSPPATNAASASKEPALGERTNDDDKKETLDKGNMANPRTDLDSAIVKEDWEGVRDTAARLVASSKDGE